MQNTLTIGTGEVRLTINGDTSRVICFNPADVAFAERFYALMASLEKKRAEYQERSKAIEANTGQDPNGLPLNLGERIKLTKEACLFMRTAIDDVFGIGTSQTAFGDTLNLDVFSQFLQGVGSYLATTRGEKMAKYIHTPVKSERKPHNRKRK